MNGLKAFVALQARLYQFLAHQDEATLQAIASGTVQLKVSAPDEAQAPFDARPHEEAKASRGLMPSDDPLQVAQDLGRLSEHERRAYLNAAGMSVAGLKRVAKFMGLTRYSNLNRTNLVDRLATHGTDHEVDEVKAAPTSATPPEKRLDVDVAAIATRLRETETEEEGTAYLHAEHLDRESLLAVAAELQLTRVNRLSQTELEKRVLKQAIGARRKFAGLRKW
ncbi:hypothetical protein FPZ12_000410 [Amycolatopsis acidicola]|uniref:Uncharacterized protein n=1 Tax=Amycolatopsis acidicola TaxID=2596893 RepID=A0A5N0VKI7_9PSEU|nr:hypothetical protein [Amycolatopsis acidicola]KAA9166715.1 hypothetical protein FPZ12_000410 [Amycolatopsis acidicola]